MNKISKKMIRTKEVYAELRKKFLMMNPRCAVYPHLPSCQIHHMKGRLGKNMLDIGTWMAVSDEGHKFIHANPAISREKGWLVYGADAK
jgi:hypothetical protein